MSPTNAHPLRVLLVDDQPIIRFSVHALCKTLEHLEVVGEAENGQRAVELADQLKPDLVLMDAQMPVLDGLQATSQILQKRPDTAVIILSAYDEHDLVREALKVGARGYICKDELTEARLTHAVRVIQAGGLFFDARTGTGWLRSMSQE